MRVGDFGLARDVHSNFYYRADKHSQVPVKWSAPEVLNDGLCTEKSDMVSTSFTILSVRLSICDYSQQKFTMLLKLLK